MQLLLRWQSLTAILFFLLNVDCIVMPGMAWLGLGLRWVIIVGALAGTAEPIYWYWYSGWFIKSEHARRAVRRFRLCGKLRYLERLWFDLKDTLAAIRDMMAETAEEHLNIDTPAKRQVLDGLLGFIGRTHIWMAYPIMVGLGILPFGWLFAIVIQRTRRPPVFGAFVLFLMFNTAKTVLIGVGLIMTPLWAKIMMLVIVAGMVGWRVWKVVSIIRTRRITL